MTDPWERSGRIAEAIDRFRIVPRLMVAGYGWLMWDAAQWFMALPDPSGPQSAFVGTLAGMGTGIFAFYVNSGKHE